MGDEIKLNFPAMQDMATRCNDLAVRVGATADLARKIAGDLRDGAMLGDAGEAFATALESNLAQKVQTLSVKIGDINHAILGAIQDMQGEDSSAAGLFH